MKRLIIALLIAIGILTQVAPAAAQTQKWVLVGGNVSIGTTSNTVSVCYTRPTNQQDVLIQFHQPTSVRETALSMWGKNAELYTSNSPAIGHEGVSGAELAFDWVGFYAHANDENPTNDITNPGNIQFVGDECGTGTMGVHMPRSYFAATFIVHVATTGTDFAGRILPFTQVWVPVSLAQIDAEMTRLNSTATATATPAGGTSLVYLGAGVECSVNGTNVTFSVNIIPAASAETDTFLGISDAAQNATLPAAYQPWGARNIHWQAGHFFGAEANGGSGYFDASHNVVRDFPETDGDNVVVMTMPISDIPTNAALSFYIVRDEEDATAPGERLVEWHLQGFDASDCR